MDKSDQVKRTAKRKRERERMRKGEGETGTAGRTTSDWCRKTDAGWDDAVGATYSGGQESCVQWFRGERVLLAECREAKDQSQQATQLEHRLMLCWHYCGKMKWYYFTSERKTISLALATEVIGQNLNSVERWMWTQSLLFHCILLICVRFNQLTRLLC